MRPRPIATLITALFAGINVVDGDTVKLYGFTYRLLGFDTPETYRARCEQERKLGKEATACLVKLMAEGQSRRLQLNGKYCGHKRPCAHLLVDEKDVKGHMISNCHAVPYNGRGPKHDWCN